MLISDKVFKVFVDVERCKFRQEQLSTYKKFSRETTQTLLSYLHRKARSYVFSCNGYHFLQIRIQLFSSMRIRIQLSQICKKITLWGVFCCWKRQKRLLTSKNIHGAGPNFLQICLYNYTNFLAFVLLLCFYFSLCGCTTLVVGKGPIG